MIKLRFSQYLLLLSLLILLVLGISACGGGGGGASDPNPQPQPQPIPATGESPLVAVGSNAALNILSANFSMKVAVGPSFAGETTSNSYRIIASGSKQ